MISDRNIHKAMIINIKIHKRIPFLDQPQSDIVVFSIINFQIYYIILSEWKHGIGHIDIITFNEEL